MLILLYNYQIKTEQQKEPFQNFIRESKKKREAITWWNHYRDEIKNSGNNEFNELSLIKQW